MSMCDADDAAAIATAERRSLGGLLSSSVFQAVSHLSQQADAFPQVLAHVRIAGGRGERFEARGNRAIFGRRRRACHGGARNRHGSEHMTRPAQPCTVIADQLTLQRISYRP
jgi:hypothetical protein